MSSKKPPIATSKKPPINWRHSKARLIIVSDLEQDLLPVDENVMSAEHAWEACYRDQEEFAKVPFPQFEERLKDHREQLAKRLARSDSEARALAQDRQLHPRQTHNHRGEPVFHLSTAKQLLRDDVKNKLHINNPDFQAMRPEYMMFKKSKFGDRIRQEVRRQKFLHYLELQRAKLEKRRRGKKNAKLCHTDKDAMDTSE
jgi:hypothetical protein